MRQHFTLLLIAICVVLNTSAQDTTVKQDSTHSRVSYKAIPAREATNTLFPKSFNELLSNITPFNQCTFGAGFSSYNARGFVNALPNNVAENFENMENYSPLFSAPMGQLLFNELDIIMLEATSGFPGKGITGLVNYSMPNAFSASKVTVSQQIGFNGQLGLYNQTLLRYNQVYGKKKNIAFYLSAELNQKKEWTYDEDNNYLMGATTSNVNLNQVIRTLALEPYGQSTPITKDQHDYYVGIAGWLDFNPAASNFDPKVSKGYVSVPLNGYHIGDFRSSYFQDVKVNTGLQFKPGKDVLIALNYRMALVNTPVQQFFNYQLKNYLFQQPRVDIKWKDLAIRLSATLENTGCSYNVERTAYHLQMTQDVAYAAAYIDTFSHTYFNQVDTLVGGLSNCAACFDGAQRLWVLDSARNVARRAAGEISYYEGYDSARNAITSIKDVKSGSGLSAITRSFNANIDYSFGFWKWMKLSIGTKYRATWLSNNEWNTGGKIFHDVTASLNASKTFWKDRFKVFATGEYNYTTDFQSRGNYRGGISFDMNGQGVTLATASGYSMPSLSQRYLYLKDFAAPQYGNNYGLGTWYTGASVAAFYNYYMEHQNDVQGAFAQLKTMDIAPLKPQTTKTLELNFRNKLTSRLFLYTQGFFNWVYNTQAYVALVTPNNDTTHVKANTEAGETNILAGIYKPFYTWTNLPVKTNSWGAFIKLEYHAPNTLTPYLTYNYFGHKKLNFDQSGVVSWNDFNAPSHKVTAGIRANDVWNGLGFVFNFKWVSGYQWNTDAYAGNVGAYHTMDAEIHYKWSKTFSTFSIGATNLYNNRHVEIPGAPRIGAWYYVGWKLDLELEHKN